MLSTTVMGSLPFWVDDWPLANFHDAITSGQTYFTRSVYEFDVCPLVAMVVNIVSDFTEPQPFRLQYTVSLFQERRKSVRESVLIPFRGAQDQAESRIEVFGPVPALIRNMGWVIDYHVKRPIAEGHTGVVGNYRGAVTRFNV